MDEVKGKIRAFIQKRFPVARERGLTDEDSLLESGAVDSLGILDVVSFFEEELGVRLEDEELVPENFDSVVALARLVESKRV